MGAKQASAEVMPNKISKQLLLFRLSNMCLNHLAFKSFIVRQLYICLTVLFICSPVYSQTKRALLVGISDYPQTVSDAWANIHGANDVNLLTPTLKEMGYTTKVLTNRSATAKGIRKELNNLIASCKQGDIVYLHFSCHGQPFEDLDGDEEDGWDEALIPYDAQKVYEVGKYEGQNHILDDELHSYFQKLRSAVGMKGLVCVVIDACHAGSSSRGEDETEDEEEVYCRGIKKGFTLQGKEFHPRINAKGHFRIPQESGLADIIIVEACRSYQSNYEIKQDGRFYGPLSYYINQVLKKEPLPFNIGWAKSVKSMMDADRRITRQNMVFETSLK